MIIVVGCLLHSNLNSNFFFSSTQFLRVDFDFFIYWLFLLVRLAMIIIISVTWGSKFWNYSFSLWQAIKHNKNITKECGVTNLEENKEFKAICQNGWLVFEKRSRNQIVLQFPLGKWFLNVVWRLEVLFVCVCAQKWVSMFILILILESFIATKNEKFRHPWV